MSAKRVYFDTLRSLAYTGISGTYAALGSAFTVNPRVICITNLTQGHMIISDDSSNSAGKLILPANSFKLFDLVANVIPNKDDSFVLEIGTQLYVKQITAPVSGAVYVELLYA